MDWYLDPTDGDAARELRTQLGAYLRRHGSGDSDFGAAELAFAEVVGNVARHAGRAAWVSVDWSGVQPVLTVHDLGPGFNGEIRLPDPESPGGRGLYLVAHLTDELRVAAKRAGGSKVSVVLPVRREHRSDAREAPRRPRPGALPAPEEADAAGAFGRESFLRALVVQLAQHVEAEQGPSAIEDTVAQVGADVGSRMEEAYRAARGIVGRLTPEQMADLYVRLKGAIDGDFYVVEANEERIVLGNRACPFGEVVKRAPALCRMTSSVFGGIAARNAEGSAVQLEERIAVGDAECRVIVWLGSRGHDAPYAHEYERPE